MTKGDKITYWNKDKNENEIKDVQENYDQFPPSGLHNNYCTSRIALY